MTSTPRHRFSIDRPIIERRKAGPLTAMGILFHNAARFDGRSSRREFWWPTLINFVLLWAGWYLTQLTHGGPAVLAWATWLAFAAYYALSAFTHAALTVRRLHDANQSGMLALLVLIPGIGWIAVLLLATLPPNSRGVRFDR